MWRAGIHQCFTAQLSVRDLSVGGYSYLDLGLLMPVDRPPAFTVGSSWIEPIKTGPFAIASPEFATGSSVAPVRIASTAGPILISSVTGSVNAPGRFPRTGSRGISRPKGRRTTASIEIRLSTG
jgi:hypothetical protein